VVRKRLHRLDLDVLSEIEVLKARHAHEPRHTIDFRAARAALSGFAVPAACKIGGMLGLNEVDGIKDDHALTDFDRVVHKPALAGFTAPNAERDLSHGLV
jgi:hypothetical protein